MTLGHWLAFAAAANVLLMIPGPTVLLVVSYAPGLADRIADCNWCSAGRFHRP
jgi:hypothetical protein